MFFLSLSTSWLSNWSTNMLNLVHAIKTFFELTNILKIKIVYIKPRSQLLTPRQIWQHELATVCTAQAAQVGGRDNPT